VLLPLAMAMAGAWNPEDTGTADEARISAHPAVRLNDDGLMIAPYLLRLMQGKAGRGVGGSRSRRRETNKWRNGWRELCCVPFRAVM